MLGPLYLLLGDVDGAFKSYKWYEKEFPEDCAEAFNHICWVLTLLRSGDEAQAKSKLRELVFDNLYIVPVMLGENPRQHDFRHGSNWRELAYILEGPCSQVFPLWSNTERAWLKEKWEDNKMQEDLSRYIDLYKELDRTKGYKERSELLRQASLISNR